MAQIKAAFFDIDGTLLPFHAKALPESTVQALAALRKNGVKTFIATGRPPVHLPYLHALDGIPFDGYVTMNGQYCYLADGDLLYTKYIPAASLQTLLPYIEKEQLSVGFVGKDFCRFNLINDLSRDFAKKLELGAGDVAALIQHEDIYQLSAFLPPEKEAEFLRRCPGCLAVRWEDDFCDILPEGGGKPNGLAHTLAHLGLTREQCIAFGDGGNDVTMLDYAGIGVAMGNGTAIAREVADVTLVQSDMAALVGLRRLSCELMKRMSATSMQVIGFNSALLALGIAGVITPQASSLLHNSSTVLFSMRDVRAYAL